MYEVANGLESKVRSQAFDEESPPTSLAINYLRNHTPILSLSSSSHPDEEEAVKAHTHVDQVIIKIISVVVVYEQGVCLKSSITVDTASRKDLTLQGWTNCPLQGSARTPISLSCYP